MSQSLYTSLHSPTDGFSCIETFTLREEHSEGKKSVWIKWKFLSCSIASSHLGFVLNSRWFPHVRFLRTLVIQPLAVPWLNNKVIGQAWLYPDDISIPPFSRTAIRFHFKSHPIVIYWSRLRNLVTATREFFPTWNVASKLYTFWHALNLKTIGRVISYSTSGTLDYPLLVGWNMWDNDGSWCCLIHMWIFLSRCRYIYFCFFLLSMLTVRGYRRLRYESDRGASEIYFSAGKWRRGLVSVLVGLSTRIKCNGAGSFYLPW